MAQPKGGGGADSNMEMWAFLIVLIFLVVFWAFSEMFWVYATAWKWLRVAELWVANLIAPDFLQNLTGWDFKGGLAFLLGSEPKHMTAEIIAEFDNIYVRFFNWLPGILIGIAGAKVFMQGENVSQFYNMETLMLKMQHAFPGNKSFLGVHPELTPLDFYPDDASTYEYSMAMTERQFATVVPPLGLMKQAEKDASLKKPIWDGSKSFNDELCRKSFEQQVGGLYRGFNGMDDTEKKLFTLFRDKILVKRKEVIPVIEMYMTQIVDDRLKKNLIPQQDSDRKKLNVATLPKPVVKFQRDFPSHKALVERLTAIVDSNLKEQGTSYRAREVEFRKLASAGDMKGILRAVIADERMSKHAFTYTGLMTLLEAAREGSTLPPSSFRWLKARNRTLWYALNCVGKKVSFTESGGTFAHWLLERETKMAVPHAEVTEAVEALRVALELPSRYASKDAIDQWG